MNRLLKMWMCVSCLTLCAALAYKTPVSAQDQSVETVINYTDGTTATKNGVLDPEKLTDSQIESIESFEVQYEDETVLEVTAQGNQDNNDSDNTDSDDTATETLHYFSVEFTVSEQDKTTCFLAGLTEDNVKTVEDTIISSIKRGDSSINMENIDFIDTEKNGKNDNQLCWAASSCNILQYTGWLSLTDFQTCDDLFDDVVENVTADAGGNERNLFSWFFNGTLYDNSKGTCGFRNGTGGYVEGYAYNKIVTPYSLMESTLDSAALSTIIDQMGKGYGSTLTIDMDGADISHSITLWGFVLDHNYKATEQEYYKYIFITDSDNDLGLTENRNYSPNKMEMYRLEPTEDSWEMVDYNENTTTTLRAINTVMPYSADVEKETDPDATLNMSRNINMGIENIVFSSVDRQTDPRTSVIKNQPIKMDVDLVNYGKKDLGDQKVTIPYEYLVTDQTGQTIADETGSVTIEETEEPTTANLPKFSIPSSNLSEGTYTVTFMVNKDKSVKEAFYYDNEYTTTFEVTSSEYDVSNMSITGNVSEYEGENATIDFTYTNMEKLLSVSGLTCTVYESDTSAADDVSTWEEAYNSSENTSLVPQNLTICQSKNIKYAFVFNGTGIDNLVIFTDTFHPSYYSFDVEYLPDDNLDDPSVRTGASSFKNNAQITCKIEDNSTKERLEDKTYTFKVVAEMEEKATELYSTDVTLAVGETEKTIVVPEKWSHPLTDLGTVEMKAYLLEDKTIIASDDITSLEVQEKGSFFVNTEVDDPTDGETSLSEALSYAEETGTEETITVSSDIKTLDFEEITINSPIIIDCSKNRTTPLRLSVMKGSSAFQVTSGASLTMNNVIITGVDDDSDDSSYTGDSKSDTGAICGTDADIILKNCNFESCKAYKGGGISLKNGSLTMSNCSFVNLNAYVGSAVFASGNAKVDALNCTILNGSTTGTGAAIYDYTSDDGYCNIVNCTILGNCSKSSGSSVEGSRTCHIVNSIVMSSQNPSADSTTYTSISGDAQVYGSYIGSRTINVSVDDTTVTGKLTSIAYLKKINNIYRECYDRKNSFQILPRLKNVAAQGHSLLIDNEEIVFKNASGSIVHTGVNTVFDSYKKDIIGNNRGSYYGSYAKTYVLSNQSNTKKLTKQTITVNKRTRTIRYKKLKKRKQSFRISAKSKTTLTYKKVKGNKKITISKNGKVTVKKKLKKGTYNVYVRITAKKTTKYYSATKTVKIKVKVR